MVPSLSKLGLGISGKVGPQPTEEGQKNTEARLPNLVDGTKPVKIGARHRPEGGPTTHGGRPKNMEAKLPNLVDGTEPVKNWG